MKLSEAVGARLNNLLNEKNWNYYKVQKEGGIPRATVARIRNSKVKTVKLNTLYDICATLGITLQEFFNDPIFNNIED